MTSALNDSKQPGNILTNGEPRGIRRRIKSIEHAQITRRCKWSPPQKAQGATARSRRRPYSEVLNKVLVSLKEPQRPCFILLQIRPTRKELVHHHQPDKGLAGALNTKLLREAATFDPDKRSNVVAGRKARQFNHPHASRVGGRFRAQRRAQYSGTKAISKFCVEKFLSGEVDQVPSSTRIL